MANLLFPLSQHASALLTDSQESAPGQGHQPPENLRTPSHGPPDHTYTALHTAAMQQLSQGWGLCQAHELPHQYCLQATVRKVQRTNKDSYYLKRLSEYLSPYLIAC